MSAAFPEKLTTKDNSLTIRREASGVYRMDGATPAQLEAILADLGPLSTQDVENVLGHVAHVQYGFLLRRVFDAEYKNDRHELDRLQKAAGALGEAHRQLEQIGPGHVHDLAEDFNGEEMDFTVFRRALSFWERELSERCDEFEVRRGRLPNEAYAEAIIDLAALYEHVTGARAGWSSKPEPKPGSGGQDVHGPFVRFCMAVLHMVEPTNTTTVQNAIRDYVRRVNK